jgi:hypothetical protein
MIFAAPAGEMPPATGREALCGCRVRGHSAHPTREPPSCSSPAYPGGATRVKPRVVVELDVDTAVEDYRWRHPCRFVRIRRDLKAADLPAQT